MQKPQSQVSVKDGIILALGILLILCGCSTPRKVETRIGNIEHKQLNILIQFNDLNEQAFAYHQICLIKTEPMNEKFLENYKDVSNRLFDECRLSLNWEPEYIVSRLLERREYIQSNFISRLSAKGCQSNEALVAQNYYILMSKDGQN